MEAVADPIWVQSTRATKYDRYTDVLDNMVYISQQHVLLFVLCTSNNKKVRKNV